MMREFNYLHHENNIYRVTSTVKFKPMGTLQINEVEKVFNFSWEMTFGSIGEHRPSRTGGTITREKKQIFADTFQGKLSEYAMFNKLKENEVKVSALDFSVHRRGKWDYFDFTLDNKKFLSVKSTKSFGNLLLLEKDDFDEKGTYKPNNIVYDFTFLIRIRPHCSDIMSKEIQNPDNFEIQEVKSLLLSKSWEYDIPGYITKDDLVDIIGSNYIIPKGAILNKKTTIDADNYYIQSKDMRPLESFVGDYSEKNSFNSISDNIE